MKMLRLLIIAAMLAAVPVVASAHSGGTEDNGCHLNHRTGDYHCH